MGRVCARASIFFIYSIYIDPSVIQSAAELAKEDLKAQLVRREAETLRLRDQREQQTSELNERKHKDSVKLASLNELKTLSEARSVSSTISYFDSHLF